MHASRILLHASMYYFYLENDISCHRRVEGGGSGGPDPPLFLDPPFSSVTPPPTQPDLTDKCNVNCFLIVNYAV